MKRFVLIGLSVSLALQPAAGWAASAREHGGTCLSGDCVNGYGTVKGLLNEYTGNWSNSWFTAGRYSILYPSFPNKHFDLVVDGQGFPLEGTVPRGSPSDELYDPTLYTGTFSKFYHPFDKKYVPHYAHGRYTDMYGVVYDGDFDYVPARSSGINGGHYIFQGVRINEEADEVRPGLYISDWTTNDVVIGEPASYMSITFHRATPDYVAKLHDDLQKDIQEADAVESAKLAKERESRENWKSLFTAAVGFVAVVGVMQAASRNSGSSSGVSALGDTISGKQTSRDAENKMVGEIRNRAKTDPALAKRIGKSTDAELVTMMKQAGSTAPTQMTMAEYRSATRKPTTQQVVGTNPIPQSSGTQTPSNGNAGTASGSTNVTNAEKAKTYLCPKREYFTSLIHYFGPYGSKVETFTFEEACARAEQKASEFVAGVGKGDGYTYSNSVVKNVELCRKTKSGEQAVVYVNMEEPSSSECRTTSTGIAR